MEDDPPEGLYEHVLTHGRVRALDRLRDRRRVETSPEPPDRLDVALTRHVADRLARALGDRDDVSAKVELVGRVLDALGDDPAEVPANTDALLRWIGPADPGLADPRPPRRPAHGLTIPALLVNGAHDVALAHELAAELDSADRVDAVIAFLKWSGFVLLRPAITRFLERGGELRLITSTYTGVTDAHAVLAMARLGARVRVAWEEDGTRLHAKAWLFHRRSGLSTAYIGSSNLSRSAMVDGQEWNVRVTAVTTPSVIDRFVETFDQLWCAGSNRDLHPVDDHARLVAALSRARGGTLADQPMFVGVDVGPKPHQQAALDALAAERERGHRRTLVVAATGTGKTWIAAFDYERLRRAGEAETLLFVAHRKEILTQTLAVFRLVLRDPGFGELLVDGARPSRGRHVFASVQSLRADAVARLDPEAFDLVVIDEFHHAAADSYARLLGHLRPSLLVGLTATPERMDGRRVTDWFDGRIASELRLWDALDAGLLAPFHYFGVHDPTSAEAAWTRGRLDPARLDRLYTGDDLRAQRVLDAVGRYVGRPGAMRALGFCVGVGHAAVMARTFTAAGLPAEVVHGETPGEDRAAALRRLAAGELRALFTVDLFNEGVDLPDVDTVLFLRPTESATVFLQQLGRGLRRSPGKSHLTVLDFVGHVHADYRYDVRYAAIVPGTRRQVRDAVAAGFPRLPAGCAIQLEPQARDTVLASVEAFVQRARRRHLVDDLRRLAPDTTLAAFLDHTGVDLTDVYDPRAGQCWTTLRRDAGHEVRPPSAGEGTLARSLGRMLHVDDRARLDGWAAWLRSPTPPTSPTSPSPPTVDGPLRRMLFVDLAVRRAHQDGMEALFAEVWGGPLRDELAQLLGVLADRVRHPTPPLDGPLALHGTYTRAEVLAAWGMFHDGRLRESREGPLWVEHAATDVFFVTLDKSDDLFRPSIRYADYPLSPTLFQWESQNRVHAGTPTGQRYIHHAARGTRVMLMVRERAKVDGEAQPFCCLGYARYVGHEGGSPMRITWALDAPMPARILQAGLAVAA